MQGRALPTLHVFWETVGYQRQLDSPAPELSYCGENLWFHLGEDGGLLSYPFGT